MQIDVSRKLFTVDDYYKMLDAGILQKGDRVELISGEILQMSPIGSRHAATVYCIDSTLKIALGSLGMVRIQLPVRIDDFNEPEPDIAVVPARPDMYVTAHPEASDTLLVVEVSDRTLTFDRTVKAHLYAIAGVAEYWIADLKNDQMIVHRDPEGDTYKTVKSLSGADEIAPLAFPDARFVARELLPRPSDR
jgi:Uma2 family endonuclease